MNATKAPPPGQSTRTISAAATSRSSGSTPGERSGIPARRRYADPRKRPAFGIYTIATSSMPAQLRPINKHRSNARFSYTTSPTLAPPAPTCPSVPSWLGNARPDLTIGGLPDASDERPPPPPPRYRRLGEVTPIADKPPVREVGDSVLTPAGPRACSEFQAEPFPDASIPFHATSHGASLWRRHLGRRLSCEIFVGKYVGTIPSF